MRIVRNVVTAASLTVVGTQAAIGWYKLGRDLVRYIKTRNEEN